LCHAYDLAIIAVLKNKKAIMYLFMPMLKNTNFIMVLKISRNHLLCFYIKAMDIG